MVGFVSHLRYLSETCIKNEEHQESTDEISKTWQTEFSIETSGLVVPGYGTCLNIFQRKNNRKVRDEQ